MIPHSKALALKSQIIFELSQIKFTSIGYLVGYWRQDSGYSKRHYAY